MRDHSQPRRLRSLVTLLAAALALFIARPAGARPVLLAGGDGRVQTVPEDPGGGGGAAVMCHRTPGCAPRFMPATLQTAQRGGR